MKKLEDYKDEINKCSKCGLCQSVCPVFKETGNECAVSRGKFIMLDGVLKGDLKLNGNINRYLDLCLKCGKCKDFCPSAIDVCQIFAYAKNQYLKKTFNGKLISFLQSDLIFKNIIRIGSLFADIFRKKAQGQGKIKLLYFKGCVNNIFPRVENALKKVLSHFDTELIEKDFDCCGVPFLSSGNLEQYEKSAKKNTGLINETDFDYILTDCASCASAIQKYPKYISGAKENQFINAAEFISTQNVEFIFEKPLKVTFHKPCHLDSTDFLKPLFKKCKNIEYVEMEGYDECCGLAGEFALHNPKISLALAKKKAQNIINTKADYVLTTCPACAMGILEGYTANGINGIGAPKVLNIIEFLALAKKFKTID